MFTLLQYCRISIYLDIILDDLLQVYLVSGGYNFDDGELSSTEIMLNDVWTMVGELPSPRVDLTAVSIDNNIILTGNT